MNFGTSIAVGAAVQVLVFALAAKLSPEIYRDHPPTVQFAALQLAVLVALAWLEVAS